MIPLTTCLIVKTQQIKTPDWAFKQQRTKFRRINTQQWTIEARKEKLLTDLNLS